ncbi:hypothetical protein Tco_1267575, partial [Tanacetum coccineum]
MSVEKDWATIKELAQYEDKGWNDPILPDERSIDHKNPNIEQLLGIMENYVDMLMKDAISIIRRSENVFGISSDMMRQLPPKLSRQEAFKDLVMNFILYQEEKDLEPLNGHKVSEALREKASFHTPKFVSPKSLCVKHVRTIFPIPPLVSESTFGFKSGTKNNRNVKSRHDVENPNPQSTPQVLPSFKVYTPPVTYPEEVEETLGTPVEVEPLNETPLEDLGLNTCNHDIPLGDKRGPKPPIKSHSSDSFRMKEVEKVRIKETHHSEHIIQQPIIQHLTLSHHNEKEWEVFTEAGNSVRIIPDGV